jgi:hypothetical protein
MNFFSAKFREDNLDFMILNQNEQEVILTNAIVKIRELDEISYLLGKVGQCEDQMASDKETCFQYAVVGGAFCGLLSPTIVLALACYASVMSADIVCHTQAEKNYEICKKYSTVNPA